MKCKIFLIDFKEGVEFKIFTNYKLDMFNAIAIESEREFGSSVFNELEKELKNRAEKFKRAGVDRIEDYRKKTNAIMPRLLLVIDECQILFSKENDLISQNATKQLEIIIKQGRSYGLHVILATQSWAGISSISNDVKTQIGVRIALKCPKEDAQYILGHENDGINLIIQGDPGQAVYNNNSGNSKNNIPIRVSYLEQHEQDELLKEISERASKILLKQNPKKADTRILLSNVEENINSLYQKFCRDGINEFTDKSLVIGESLQLYGNLKMNFTASEESNLLIIGEDKQKARAMFTFSILSLILGFMNKNKAKPSKPLIDVIDYVPPEDDLEERYDTLSLLSNSLTELLTYTKIVPFTDSKKQIFDALKNIYDNVESNENRYLFVFGLQRANELRSSSKSVSTNTNRGLVITTEAIASSYEMFVDIVSRGALNGVHTIIWEDFFTNFTRYYADLQDFFRLRIGFTMPDKESGEFMDEPYGSKLGENNAIFNCYGNQKFRPYKTPDLEWLGKICQRIKEANS